MSEYIGKDSGVEAAKKDGEIALMVRRMLQEGDPSDDEVAEVSEFWAQKAEFYGNLTPDELSEVIDDMRHRIEARATEQTIY